MNIFEQVDPLIDYSNMQLIIFDVDGTLYDQMELRIYMLLNIIIYIIKNPKKLYELKLIYYYRKLFEDYDNLFNNGDNSNNIDNILYEEVAEKFDLDIKVVKEIVYKWIYSIPLKYIKKFKKKGINDLFNKIKRNNINIAIYSDYPSEEKLKILGLSVDLIVASIDKEINRLKPNPKGLLYIINYFGVNLNRCLLIGDRDDRDGKCARNANISFIKV